MLLLLLLRAAPPMTWLARIRPLDWLVTTLNSRALTICLWHNAAIAVSFAVGDLLGFWRLGQLGYLVLALLTLTGLVLALGWIEDLSAGRAPRLLPRPRPARTARRDQTPRPAGQPTGTDEWQEEVAAVR